MIYATVLPLLVLVGLYVCWRMRYRYPPRHLPQVLCYHKISTRFLFEGTWTTPGRFVVQIDRLMDQGYRFIDEDRYVAALDGSRSTDKELLLTFDDGYAELERLHADHLAPRGIPLLVFLVTGFVGDVNRWDLSLGRRAHAHLAWDAVARMGGSGVGFGSHGVRHLDLTRLDRDMVRREVRESKAAIEERLGVPVRSFSFPFGRYDGRSREAVRDAGYTMGFSMYPQHCNERVDRFALRRNGVYIIDTVAALERRLGRGPGFWFEEMKCRAINGVARVTPLLKRIDGARDTGSRSACNSKPGITTRAESPPARKAASGRSQPR